LKFGQFTLKSGRISPYFFNAGGFDDGHSLQRLSECYAQAILDSGIAFDMLFGPAYKGIPLAAGIAIMLNASHQQNIPFAYNRKEAKDHGEGGTRVGAKLAGNVLIVDDVITAGTAIRESLRVIAGNGARTAGVLIALDRQERGQGQHSAAQEIANEFGIPVIPIVSLSELLDYTRERPEYAVELSRLEEYRRRYGV
jgi:orotate phosphoribosyltransferase